MAPGTSSEARSLAQLMGVGGVPYGSEGGRFVESAAAGSISIIPEGRDGATEFETAQKLLGAAEALCFLGFGFDGTNIERLGGTAISAGARYGLNGNSAVPVPFAASSFGLAKAERQQAARRISNRFGNDPAYEGMLDSKSLATLRESLILV